MNKKTGMKRKVNSIVLALCLAVGLVFPLSVHSQTTLEWIVLSIMRSQSASVWQTILDADAKRSATIFPER